MVLTGHPCGGGVENLSLARLCPSFQALAELELQAPPELVSRMGITPEPGHRTEDVRCPVQNVPVAETLERIAAHAHSCRAEVARRSSGGYVVALSSKESPS